MLNGLAGGMYIGSQFGAGPRDGLMTGLVRRTGRSIRLVRTSLELTVLALGWLLGGVVGIGTVLYALAIGPLVQLFLPRLTVALRVPDRGDGCDQPAASAGTRSRVRRRPSEHGGGQRRVATSTDASSATMTSTAVKRGSVSHCSRRVSIRPA